MLVFLMPFYSFKPFRRSFSLTDLLNRLNKHTCLSFLVHLLQSCIMHLLLTTVRPLSQRHIALWMMQTRTASSSWGLLISGAHSVCNQAIQFCRQQASKRVIGQGTGAAIPHIWSPLKRGRASEQFLRAQEPSHIQFALKRGASKRASNRSRRRSHPTSDPHWKEEEWGIDRSRYRSSNPTSNPHWK